MPEKMLTQLLLLPELKLVSSNYKKRSNFLHVEKTSIYEVCPKCACISESVYDHRRVKIKDSPLRKKLAYLVIRKRRFWCKTCSKPFTEPVSGIKKYRRTTERYRNAVLTACERYVDLKSVRKDFKCSSDFIYKALYEQLELERRKRLYPWPKTIGIDEHFFKKNEYGYRSFVTVITDFNGKRLMEVIEGKTHVELQNGLSHIKGKENVKNVVMDMCKPYKNFALNYFPNARLIADKFHVVRLLHPHINRRRKQIAGDARRNPVARLLLKDSFKLEYFKKRVLRKWLEQNPELKEIYDCKEALHSLYRIKGYNKAKHALIRFLDYMALSKLPEIQTFRNTLYQWRNEILNYFATGLTNARTEGFNNKAKLVKRRGYGYKSFKNYRLRLLNACA